MISRIPTQKFGSEIGREQRGRAVRPAPAVHGGDDPGGHGDEQRHQHGRHRQRDRHREAGEDRAGDRLVAEQRRSQIALQGRAGPGEVLDEHRVVEPEPLPGGLDLLGGRVLARDRDRRVAGDHQDEREHAERDQEQQRDDHQDPSQRVLQHDPHALPMRRMGEGENAPTSLWPMIGRRRN
nr:hypothetical protein [Pseudonocardia nigra]